MPFKIGTTNVSDINFKQNNTTTSLTRVDVKQNGVTTQVWGKRDFTLYTINENNFGSLTESYKDAGLYNKSITPSISVSNNKIIIDKTHFTLSDILSMIRYGNSTEAGWRRTNTSSSAYQLNGDQTVSIFASGEPSTNFFGSNCGIGIRATYGYGVFGTECIDTYPFWEIVYFDYRDSSNTTVNYLWVNSIDPVTHSGNQYYPYGYNYFNNNWDSSTGFINTKPSTYSDNVEITDDYIIITLPVNISYSDNYMKFYAGKFLGKLGEYTVNNVGFDQGGSVTTTVKTQGYDYTYDIGISGTSFTSSDDFAIVSSRKWLNSYTYDSSNRGTDVRNIYRSYNSDTSDWFTNGTGVDYGSTLYMRILCADGYFPTGTEGVDYFSYTTIGGELIYYVVRGPVTLNGSVFNLTKPSSIKTNGSSSKYYGGIFTRVTWDLTLNLGSNIGSITYTIDGVSTTITSNTTITNLDYDTTVSITATGSDGETTPWTFTNTGSKSCPTPTSTHMTSSVTVSATRKSYTITFTKGSYGSWSNTSRTGYYGDTISRLGNVVSIYKWDDGTLRYSSTYTLNSDTAQYHYSNTYSTITSPITSTQTITSTDTRSIQSYTITWNNYDGTTLETDTNVNYGTTPTYDGSTPTKPSTSQYTYTFSGWSPSVHSVTGDETYVAQFTETPVTYTITLASTYGHWINSSGTTITSISNVAYGTSISSSSNVLTIGSNTYTFVKNSDTTSYNYVFSSITWSPSGSTITGATTVTGTATRYSRPYVYITAGTGVSSVYTSTSSTATSGNASGTRYDRGSTVYGFAVLSTGYDAASGWTLVSGTAGTAGSKYRVFTKTNLTSNYNYGTANAVAKTYTITLASNNGYWTNSGGSTITSTTASYGSSVSVSGSTLTIASSTYTFHANSGYEVTSITGAPSTITGNVTITGNTQSSVPTLVVSSGNKYFGLSGKSTYTIATQSQFSSYTGRSITMSGTMTITRQSGSSTTFGNTTITWNSILNSWIIGSLWAWGDDPDEDYGSAEINLYIDSSGNLIADWDAWNTYNLDTSSIPVSTSWSNLTFTPQ